MASDSKMVFVDDSGEMTMSWNKSGENKKVGDITKKKENEKQSKEEGKERWKKK